MQAESEQLTAPPLRALLDAGTLAGEWVLDPRESTIRLSSTAMGGLATVKGAFRDVSGHGTVSPDGRASGTIAISAASIDTRNSRRDTHLRSAWNFLGTVGMNSSLTVHAVVARQQGGNR